MTLVMPYIDGTSRFQYKHAKADNLNTRKFFERLKK